MIKKDTSSFKTQSQNKSDGALCFCKMIICNIIVIIIINILMYIVLKWMLF